MTMIDMHLTLARAGMRQDKVVEGETEKMNTNVADEIDSETSFGGESSFLDRLGIKIDDALHRIFTT